MERIGVREPRQYVSRYLARVKAGATVAVTERGQLIALLVPPSPILTARERLFAAGRLISATRLFRFPHRVFLRPDQPSTAEILDELRSERLP